MITWNSKLSEWIKIISSVGACSSLLTYGVGVVQKWSDDIVKIKEDGQEPTIREAYEYFKTLDLDIDYLILWLTCNMGSEVQFEASLREEVAKSVRDPKIALKIYYKSSYITESEEEILKSKFIVNGKHLFPTIEKELADGKIIRAKNMAEVVGLGDLSELGQYIRANNTEANKLEDNEINI